MIKRCVIFFVGVIFVFLLATTNKTLAFSSEKGDYPFICEQGSSTKIISATAESARAKRKFLSGVKGETLRVLGNENTANDFIKKYSMRVVKTQKIENMTIFYGVGENMPYHIKK